MTRQYFRKVIVLFFIASFFQAFKSDARIPTPSLDTIDKLLEKAKEEGGEKGLKTAFLALQQSRNSSLRKQEADALLTIGDLHFNGYSDLEAAIEAREYYIRATKIYTEINNGAGAINAIKGQLRCDYALEKYEETLKYAIQIEDWALKINNKEALEYAYRHFARIYARFLNDTELSQKYLQQCIALYEDEDQREESALDAIYSDLGSIHYTKSEYDSALYYYMKGLPIAISQQHSYAQALLETNIATVYFEMGQVASALEYTNQALSSATKNEVADLKSRNYSRLGDIHALKGKYAKAIDSYQTALNHLGRQDLYEQKRSIYNKLKDTYTQLGDFKKALLYADKIDQAKDSSNILQSVDKINLIKANHELEKKEKEIQFLEKQAASQKTIRNAIILGAALSIFILLLLYNHITLKAKLQRNAYEQLKTRQLLEEKEKLHLKEQLQFKERELASQTVFIIQKNEMLSNLREQIGKLKPISESPAAKDLQSLSRTIDHHMNFDSDWEKFKLHFEQVHPLFFSKLRDSFPDLNTNEARFLSYIRMGLSTKEIAQLLGINATSVQKSRYRLKKKMDLEKEVTLIEFIEQF